MRFEIRTAGFVAIVLGLASLSAVVFVLGMFAGYEVAGESVHPDTQVASVYPVPNPPAAKSSPASSSTMQAMASPVASPSPEARASQAAPAKVARRRPAAKPSIVERTIPSSKAASGVLPARPVTNPASTPAPVSTPAIARAHIHKPPAPAPAEQVAASPVATPQSLPTHAAVASRGSLHKPYNIQIDAVMDRVSADLMVSRMRKLGYHAFLVPTSISGKIWWRVRVGPYRTKNQALDAQDRLRAEYQQAYGPGGGAIGDR